MRELATEELWQTLHLELMYRLNAKPSRAAWYYEGSLGVFLLYLHLNLLILISLCLSLVVPGTPIRLGEHILIPLSHTRYLICDTLGLLRTSSSS